MQRFVLLFFVLIVFACGEKPTHKNQSNNSNLLLEKTSIEFSEKMHNFGHLNAGEIVLFSFEFTNTGTSDYKIKNIQTDCGCIQARFKNELVKPGETGLIEIEFDTSGMVGKEFKTIEIDGNSKELKHLAIFAEIKNEILDIKY